MTRTSSTSEPSEREPMGIPDKVRCRPDPDGVVVWVPVDEPEDDPTGGEADERERHSPYVDQG